MVKMSKYNRLVSFEDETSSSENMSSAETMSSDDEVAPPPPTRFIPPPKRRAPLNPLNVVIQTCLNEVGIIKPDNNSQEALNKFCDALAEKINVMEQIMRYIQTNQQMKKIYELRQQFAGSGLVAWRHAFRVYQHRLEKMIQHVFDINMV